MKSSLNKLFFLCVFIFTIGSNAQNLTKHEMLEFLPYSIGNSWSYWWIYYNNVIDFSEAGKDKFVISKDTVVNNSNYWLIKYYYYGYNQYSQYLERIDTATGNVLRISDISFGEINCVDNLYANVGDTVSISNNIYLLYCDRMVVKSLRDTVINNFNTTIREVVGMPYEKKLFFARNIGLLGVGPNYWIDTAYVNRMLFYDISSDFTDINENIELIGSNYILFQKYPNPFNPNTKIRYSVPKNSYISIKVFDILGNEISTLVNQYINAGEHEVVFNAENLSSGVYFYQLNAESLVLTKKLLFIK